MFEYQQHKFEAYVAKLKAEIKEKYGKISLFKLWMCNDIFLYSYKDIDPDTVAEVATSRAEEAQMDRQEFISAMTDEIAGVVAYAMAFEYYKMKGKKIATEVNLSYWNAQDDALDEYYDTIYGACHRMY